MSQETKTDELTEPEKRFLKRVVAKYSQQTNPLYRSLAIITVLIVAAHLLERCPMLPWWVVFPMIYIPAIWMFYRYRRFAIFKTRLMCKLARDVIQS